MLPWVMLIVATAPFTVLAKSSEPKTNSGCVILRHELGRTADSMVDLAGALKADTRSEK